MTFIETGIPLTDIAKTMKTTVARVETEAHALNLFIGENWAGKPALSEIDAAGMLSGATKRAQEGSHIVTVVPVPSLE